MFIKTLKYKINNGFHLCMSKATILIFPILYLTIFMSSARSQTPEEILRQVRVLPAFRSAELGIYVKNLSDEIDILKFNEDRLMAPASILKIRTVRRAMDIFGPEHRFKTKVTLAGEIDQSIFYGDIIIKGYGDPSFGSQLNGATDLKEVVSELIAFFRQHGITCIYGAVVADASYFDLPGIPSGYIAEDVGNYYGAGAYGLNIQDNAYEITFNRKKNLKPTIWQFDSMAVSFVSSDVIADGQSDQAYIYDHPMPGGVHVVGKIPFGQGLFKIKGSIKMPPFYAAKKLQHMLAASGIEFQREPRVIWESTADIKHGVWLKEYSSPPMAEFLKPILHKSNNMYAEVLHRHVLKAGVESRSASAFRVDDGSGLSPTNRITATELMNDLQRLMESDHFPLFLENMPKNGLDGTVRSVLKNLKDALYLKSGSIGGVRAYMGFRRSKSGDWIGFVCMANEITSSGNESRKAWEVLLDWIVDM
jgi:D-alanyl-D-alanine carboxypeptidase/D-alanyl-D-alanine-endopeptidase (penicillin-binding protein 4)